ncbi:hypothetical protein HD554DRAFT_1668992 [Boletus coccyginus]|nr:hypothetical protein HD554DRAFT_1668992 [Boletus coccyginus]
MPEERTMSVFTRMNSMAHNRQQVRTLVDMTHIQQWHMYDPTRPMHEYPTVSFYDLDSLLKPASNEASQRSTLSHKTEGSYLVAEDADGAEEAREDETETWLDETQTIQDPERDTCFEMEHNIDLQAAIVTQGMAPVPEKEVEETPGSTMVDGEEDLDNAWDW